jgi:hypothetical protein
LTLQELCDLDQPHSTSWHEALPLCPAPLSHSLRIEPSLPSSLPVLLLCFLIFLVCNRLLPFSLAMTNHKMHHVAPTIRAMPVRRSGRTPHRVANMYALRLASFIADPTRPSEHTEELPFSCQCLCMRAHGVDMTLAIATSLSACTASIHTSPVNISPPFLVLSPLVRELRMIVISALVESRLAGC